MMPDETTQKTESDITQAFSNNSPDNIELSFLQCRLPANLLKMLFDRLDISVQTGALNRACRTAQKDLTEVPPAQRMGLILKTLCIERVQVAQLHWRRFDQRRLPTLLFYDGQWQLIERGPDGLLTLTDESENSCDYTEDQLDGGIVLWLKLIVRQKKAFFFTLRGNIAARMVWRAIFKQHGWLYSVVIATLIINLLAISTSLFALQVYDRVVPTLAYDTLKALIAVMVIMVSLDWLLKTCRARILDSLSCDVDKSVSCQVFDHVMRLQLDTRPRSLGTLAAQVGGLDSVKIFFSSGIVFALVDMPFAFMFIGFIAIIGGPVAFVYLLLLPVAVILGWITQKRLRRLMKHQMIRSNERQGLLVDAIQGTESIRANNAAWRFSEQWKDITVSISRYNIQQKAISNFGTVTTGSLSTIAYVSALVVGVGQIEAGNLTMGSLIACSILGGRVIAPAAQSVQYLTQWQNVSQALQMVNQVLLLSTERRPDQHLIMPDQAPDSIGLEGVRFSYSDSPVLQLNIPLLSFKSGDRVAVFGPVGSGKSTLLKVLAGLYRPSEGRVRLGDGDLWEIDPTVVVNHIGYLPQTVHLFKGTLRSNLALSGITNDSHLLQVIRQLGVDKIAADSPQSMELAISEGGEGLSGGQRQLVGLARVFLAQPRIWILDEPTASLDNDSENQVINAILDHVKPEDILLISTHRPALAARLANRILVMQRGTIIKDGQPDHVFPQMMKVFSKRPGVTVPPPKVEVQLPDGLNPERVNKGPANVI